MKKTIILTAILSFSCLLSFSQYAYDRSEEHPYGKPNPEAPKQIKDYEDLIGECNCKSTSRNPDGSWADSIDMIWKWNYIMNGMGIQDGTLKTDGNHSGSIRQFSADSSKWYVHYFSSKSPTTTLSTWTGNKEENGNIVLYKEQNAPNGTEGTSRLTFYDISKTGYKWVGEWVDKSETIIYPFWKIECTR